MIRDHFRVLVADLTTGRGTVVLEDGRDEVAGGSGLAARLFARYGRPEAPWDHPDQPLILAIGPLTGAFPLKSKTVFAFKSPYHDQYTESHAGGRSALALRFADLDALVIVGRAASTISRELRRNATTHDGGYRAEKAHSYATARRRRCRRGPRFAEAIHRLTSNYQARVRGGKRAEQAAGMASVDQLRHRIERSASKMQRMVALGDRARLLAVLQAGSWNTDRVLWPARWRPSKRNSRSPPWTCRQRRPLHHWRRECEARKDCLGMPSGPSPLDDDADWSHGLSGQRSN